MLLRVSVRVVFIRDRAGAVDATGVMSGVINPAGAPLEEATDDADAGGDTSVGFREVEMVRDGTAGNGTAAASGAKADRLGMRPAADTNASRCMSCVDTNACSAGCTGRSEKNKRGSIRVSGSEVEALRSALAEPAALLRRSAGALFGEVDDPDSGRPAECSSGLSAGGKAGANAPPSCSLRKKS